MSLPEQLDYAKIPFNGPDYRMSKILPLSGVNTTVLGLSGGTETIFEIPVNALNLSKSFLRCQGLIAASAVNTHINRLYCDTCPLIRQIQLYTRSGMYLCDLNEMQNYCKVVWNAETKLSDFLTHDFQTQASNVALGNAAAQASAIGSGPLFFRSDAVKTAAGAERPLQGATGSTVSYTEPKYVLQSTQDSGAGESQMTFNLTLPFHMIKNTILSLDKDLYFGEVLVLRIVWQSRNKVYYTGTSTTNADTGHAAAAADVNIGSIALYVAVERNQAIANGVIAQTLSAEGMSVLIPYVYTYKNNFGNGTQQNVSLRFNIANGRKLKKIYHSLFNNTESDNSAYDHSNVNAANVSKYYSLLNNVRMQEYDIDCTNLDGYYLIHNQLKGSVIQNPEMYQYNFFHLEDFSNFYKLDKEGQSNLDVGLPLDVEQKWDIYLTTAANAYNHYTFAITEKMLVIKAGPSNGVMVM